MSDETCELCGNPSADLRLYRMQHAAQVRDKSVGVQTLTRAYEKLGEREGAVCLGCRRPTYLRNGVIGLALLLAWAVPVAAASSSGATGLVVGALGFAWLIVILMGIHRLGRDRVFPSGGQKLLEKYGTDVEAELKRKSEFPDDPAFLARLETMRYSLLGSRRA